MVNSCDSVPVLKVGKNCRYLEIVSKKFAAKHLIGYINSFRGRIEYIRFAQLPISSVYQFAMAVCFRNKMSPNRIVGGCQLLAQIKGYGSGSSRIREAAPSHRLRPPLTK
jgi:hypothetical protein